jgi:hypothetical protein
VTPIELAEVHQHDKTGSLPIVSRALLECHVECLEQARLLGISGSREAALLARVARLEEALRKLRAFALDMMGEWPEACDRDGFDIQETAARHGLLQRQDPPPTEPCAEDCACASYYPPEDFKDGGVVCYRKTDLIAEGVRE